MRCIVCDTRISDPCDLLLVPGKNLVTGEKTFVREFGGITSIERDLLTLASAIFVADLAYRREEREAYIRTIQITIPVTNLRLFNALKDQILSALIVLSSDNWNVTFVRSNGSEDHLSKAPETNGRVLLFSGGLDSYAAATSFSSGTDDLFLVSHITHNQTVESSQIELKDTIEKKLGRQLHRYAFRVGGRKSGDFYFPGDSEREDSQRTRSFLFLSLAALVANRKGCTKIINIAENGQFAIHVPLSAARIGPFSTHTAHPEFVYHMQCFFRELFDKTNLEIVNPFLYNTKAEVVSQIPSVFRADIPKSISCWKASRISSLNHCGECIPCLSRRVALEANDIHLAEYSRDILAEDIERLPHDNNGKRNLIDYLEFAYSFRGYSPRKKTDLMMQFSDLYNDFFDSDRAIDMYCRMANDVYNVMSKYPRISKLLR